MGNHPTKCWGSLHNPPMQGENGGPGQGWEVSLPFPWSTAPTARGQADVKGLQRRCGELARSPRQPPACHPARLPTAQCVGMAAALAWPGHPPLLSCHA